MEESNTDLGTAYDSLFFETMDRDARRSAQVILPLLKECFVVKSVADFGCGNGEWLRVWKQLEAEDVVGIDGDFINLAHLLIEPSEFHAHDLREPVDLGRKFDLVQSLEVAEHLPAARAEAFVDMLVAHGDRILFSAAVPGQMGIQHINEQPYEYWRQKFERRGFVLVDWIRPQVEKQLTVAFWYRYNILLFVSQSEFEKLPAHVQACRIPEGSRVQDVSPFAYRLRRAFTRWLPVPAVDRIIHLAHHFERRQIQRET